MFLSDTHLPQKLTRAHYRDAAYFDREVERAFQPAWHMIASTADFPRDGDFRKFTLLGKELLLWRCGDGYQCFLNVCAHRFCAITDLCQGNQKERLRCQYHGWEFDPTGNTRKIPDAPSFRPLSKGAVKLVSYPVERVGQLLFVSLAENPGSLKEFLGPAYDKCAERFSDEYRQVWACEPVCEGNWKLAVEVTLEGYHIIAAHEKTLGKYPMATEEQIAHEYPDAEHSVFRADHSNDPHSLYKSLRLIARVCGWEPDLTWYHYHAFPHFGCISSNSLSTAQCVIPVSAERCINLHRVFVRKSRKRNPGSRFVARMNGRAQNQLAHATLAEDCAVIAAHHRGLKMSEPVRGGLISRREERIVHFQNYVLGLYDGVEVAEPRSSCEPVRDAGRCESPDSECASHESRHAPEVLEPVGT